VATKALAVLFFPTNINSKSEIDTLRVCFQIAGTEPTDNWNIDEHPKVPPLKASVFLENQ
jgi:hypothetical protein